MRLTRLRSHVVVTMLTAIMILSSLILTPDLVRAEDYTFGSETVNYGYSLNPANRDGEDGSFNSLVEEDRYSDTNFSGSSENMVIGTTGGGSFPSALDNDDGTRRNYIEADTGAGPSYQILRPTSDGSPLTMVPTPSGTHYTCLDETTVGGNGDTDYIEGITNLQEDTYGMSDATDPGGSYNIDVLMWIIHSDEGVVSNLQTGLDIGGTNYLGWQGDGTSGVYTNNSYTWTVDPSDSLEWTLAEINALDTYQVVTDANPDTRTTQIALRISFAPTASYQLDAQITYNSVTTSSQTTGFQVLCQGYRAGDSENVLVQVWNYSSTTWIDKATINTGSDADYNFDLLGWAANCERSSGNVVLIRLKDASDGDAAQTTAYMDVLKVKRIEQGYDLDIEMTASSTNQYGEQRLRIKAYTTAETFGVDLYNWTASSWDADKISITALTNTWYQFDLYEPSQRSGSQQVKIRFVDATDYIADISKDTCYLDVAWISWIHTDPYMTDDACDPNPAYYLATVHFWVKVWDIDNELPSATYPKVTIAGTPYTMTENSTGDTSTVDGKAYFYDKSDLPIGIHDFYFMTKDANSGEITTTTKQIEILNDPNEPPYFTSSPITTVTNNTTYIYDAEATDPENDPLTFDLDTNNTDLQIGPTNGTIWGVPKTIGWYNMNLSVTDGTSVVWQNFTLTIEAPSEFNPIFAEFTITLVLGIVLADIGYLRQNPVLMLLSGLTWIFGGVAVFVSLDVVWSVIGMGFGIVMLVEGGETLVKQ